jgi:predicted transcriptional regulator
LIIVELLVASKQMIQQPASTSRTAVPSTIESPCAKLVYLYLSTHGGATVTELQESLELKKITLYSVLRTLRDRRLVTEDGDRYVVA